MSSLEDPDNSAVNLDKAEAHGLLGWPDIIGKQITINGATDGTCVQVGPIGFVVEIEHEAAGAGRFATQHWTERRLYTWAGVASVSWEHGPRVAVEPTEATQSGPGGLPGPNALVTTSVTSVSGARMVGYTAQEIADTLAIELAVASLGLK